MIRKTAKGYVVFAESGKRLSKPYKTKSSAEKRLREVEMFKHMNKK